MFSLIKKIFLILYLIIFLLPSSLYAYVSVKGYYRSNGTYVAPHVRSEPNGLKYDNYGYKPSQGLYNKSYGTRGSDWDTPTWDTDPNYYEGKSIYDSGNNLDGYTIDNRPKGMSKRQFKALKDTNNSILNNFGVNYRKNSNGNSPAHLPSSISSIQKEINSVKKRYQNNPDGFRERLIDQITEYLSADKAQVMTEVYSLLPDIK